jgi:uncharacterized RDD family membrane protein YckC
MATARPWNGEKVLLQYELLPSSWERLSARLIDDLLLGGVAVALLVTGLSVENLALIIFGFAVAIPGAAIYETVCLARTGQTLGKRIKGLRVVRVADGRPPLSTQALFRWMVLRTIFWAQYGVLTTSNHRGAHDRWADTVVVYADVGSG